MSGYSYQDDRIGLERNDFKRFFSEFSQIIFEEIPTVKKISFIDPPDLLPALDSDEKDEDVQIRESIERAVETSGTIVLGTTLLLPFTVKDGTVVAKVDGLDEYVLRKIGNDWLDGLGTRIIRGLLLVKRSCIDSVTGLLSSLHLKESLDSLTPSNYGMLVLISVYPKGNNSFQAKKHQRHTLSLLKNFIDDRFPLHYLGQSCFGMLCEKCDTSFATVFAPTLVNFLKREHCDQVHVALVPYVKSQNSNEYDRGFSEGLLRQSYNALRVAVGRGPFAFCNYSSIEDAAHHPLAPSSTGALRWLLKTTRGLDQVGLFQFDSEDKSIVVSIKNIVGEDAAVYIDSESIYLVVSYKSEKKCLTIAKNILKPLHKSDSSQSVINCGISCFPSWNFKKTELLANCRKALCHAHMLDPGAIVVCDEVSFNISGDIYYGDGDLTLAVKEYKRGLLILSSDGNLLNSLGVCYAQMNKHQLAVDCFEKASKSKENRFMALYNLGLEQQIQNKNQQAMKSFDTALGLPEEKTEQQARLDMSFQLAVLFIQDEQYEPALKLILAWYAEQKQSGNGGKGLRYLGEACYGVGNATDAMKYLQKAIHYDEYDAEVLGLLGQIYLSENEGDDIALRFCEKAVELSPDSRRLKVSLASAQIQCGDFQSAIVNLQLPLRNSKTRPAALLQRGILSLEQGKLKTAKKWFAKIKKCNGSNSKILAVAREYTKNR